MPHDIGEMFWHGEVPWHELGRKVDQPATVDEALRAGGLDWDVKLVPLTTADGAPPCDVPQRMAVVREGDEEGEGRRVLGVVHPGFRPLQNREAAELVDGLYSPGSRKFHTGGYLRNGEVVWLLARLPERINVDRDDIVEPYLLISNSHDGSRAIDLRLTTIRVVCRNTLSLALGSRARALRRAHKVSPATIARDAEAFMQPVLEQIRQTEAWMRAMAERPCSEEEFQRFVWSLLPDPRPPRSGASAGELYAYQQRRDAALRARWAIMVIREDGLADRGIPVESPTWWGSLNAFTAWVDHVQPIAGARFAHAVLGAGDRIKAVAYRRALWSAKIVEDVATRRSTVAA